MNETDLKALLAQVQEGKLDVDAAVGRLKSLPFEQLDFATIDHHRQIRCGFPEVIYCQSKTPEQTRAIFGRLAERGDNVLATRATPETYAAVVSDYSEARYNELGRTITLIQGTQAESAGEVVIVAAGTSDLPVAEEARVTAETMGPAVRTHYDVGVAGLHRLLACSESLQQADAVVAVAGMEGALASVVGGLVACPVIAVPTSVGYGASFGGLAALLTMLNSCASGVAVVNIDNGFSGGYLAAVIARQSVRTDKPEGETP